MPKAAAATTKAAMSGESGCRIDSTISGMARGASIASRKAETKSVLPVRPVASSAASNTPAAPLARNTAITATLIASEIQKNHVTGRRFMLSLAQPIFARPPSSGSTPRFVEGRPDPVIAASTGGRRRRFIRVYSGLFVVGGRSGLAQQAEPP